MFCLLPITEKAVNILFMCPTLVFSKADVFSITGFPLTGKVREVIWSGKVREFW